MRYLLFVSLFFMGCSGGKIKDEAPPKPKPVPITDYLTGSPYLTEFVDSWKMALTVQGYLSEEMPFSDGLVIEPAKVLIEWQKIDEASVCSLILETKLSGEYVTSSATCQIL